MEGPAIFKKFNFGTIGVFQEIVMINTAMGVPKVLIGQFLNSLRKNEKVEFKPDKTILESQNLLIHHNKYNTFGFHFSKEIRLRKAQLLSFGMNYKFLQSLGGYGV